MTQPKYVDQLEPSETPTAVAELVAALQEGEVLVAAPGSRFAWHALSDDRATLFADGDGIDCDLALAREIANRGEFDASLLDYPGAAEVLTRLFDAGSLGWPVDDMEDDDA